MELNVNPSALSGQDIDPNAFQRVWDRVSPAAQPDAVASTPAEPSTPPEDVTQTPSQPLSPVPCCPAENTQPAVPCCPSQTQCPECPACSECPSQPSDPETPELCLGEASQGDSGRLEQLMDLAKAGMLAGQALARRASGSCAKTLSALARDHRLALRRLSAAYFLITGKRYAPKCPALCLPSSLALALRQQFVWEQQWERENRQAAQAAADPCLKELYLELAQEGALHAGCIRSILEQMA